MNGHDRALLDVRDYIDRVGHHAEAVAAAAATTGLDAPVPTCPDWLVRDLVRHLGGVHRWATAFARGRTEPWDVELDEIVGTWPPDAALLGWFRQGAVDLCAALADAGADLRCWTFLPAPTATLMWARRQAHETAIHRVDAERAAGRSCRFEPRFADDGIDELLGGFVPRRRTLRAEPARTLAVETVDTNGSWIVTIAPDSASTSRGRGPADCRLAGSASDVYLALWNRAALDAVELEGDTSVVLHFLDSLRVTWS